MATLATTDTYAVLGAMLKTVYKDEVSNYVPEWAIVQGEVEFSQKDMVGDKYVEVVALTGEHGVSYALITDGAFNLNAPVAMNTAQASVNPPQIYLQAQLELTMLSRAQATGPKAVASASKTVMKEALKSLRRRLEIALIYGGVGLGKCASSANVDANNTVVTITTAHFAPGIWTGAENAQIVFLNVASQIGVGAYTITAVDVNARTITVNNTTAVAALDTAISGNPNILDIWFATGNPTIIASSSKEMVGLHSICGNSGTLFGINSSGFGQWKGNTFDCLSQNLTKANLGKAVAKAFNKGYMGKLMVLVHPATWNDLEAETGPLRVFNGFSDKMEQGAEKLVYHSQTGSYEVKGHPMVKEGFAYVFPPDQFKRVGSRDIELGIPGLPGDAIERVPGTNYLQVPFMTDQALFTSAPSHCVLIQNIVNG